jgi:hypothetical protein
MLAVEMSRDDYEEDLHAELGYRTAGRREISQREWFSLRGEVGEAAPNPKAFDALINRLRVKKWAKENPERQRSRNLRYALKPQNSARNSANARKRRRARFVKDARVIVCADCGVEFCEAKPRGGLPRRFCSDVCGTRAVQRERRRASGQPMLHCRICGEAGHNARRHK